MVDKHLVTITYVKEEGAFLDSLSVFSPIACKLSGRKARKTRQKEEWKGLAPSTKLSAEEEWAGLAPSTKLRAECMQWLAHDYVITIKF